MYYKFFKNLDIVKLNIMLIFGILVYQVIFWVFITIQALKLGAFPIPEVFSIDLYGGGVLGECNLKFQSAVLKDSYFDYSMIFLLIGALVNWIYLLFKKIKYKTLLKEEKIFGLIFGLSFVFLFIVNGIYCFLRECYITSIITTSNPKLYTIITKVDYLPFGWLYHIHENAGDYTIFMPNLIVIGLTFGLIILGFLEWRKNILLVSFHESK